MFTTSSAAILASEDDPTYVFTSATSSEEGGDQFLREEWHVLLSNLFSAARDSQPHLDLNVTQQTAKLLPLGVLAQPPEANHVSIWPACQQPS